MLLLDYYEQKVRPGRHKLKDTISRYRLAIRRFAEFSGRMPAVNEVTTRDLIAFELWLTDQGRARATVAQDRALVAQVVLAAAPPALPPSEVETWLVESYAPGRHITKTTLVKYRRGAQTLSQWLGRPVTWADLTDEVFERWIAEGEDRHRRRGRTVSRGWSEEDSPSRETRRRHAESLRCLLCAKNEKVRPKRETKNPIMRLWRAAEAGEQGPPDSLVHLCVQQYFKKNLRIRKDATKRQYRIAIGEFAKLLGRPPTIADLDDDTIAAVMGMMLDRGLAVHTVNGRRDCIHALWSWLSKRGHINPVRFPTTPPLDEPWEMPTALTREELERVYAQMGQQPGTIGDIAAADWWQTLFLVMFESGERVGALRQAEWQHLTGEWLHLPYKVRKQAKQDGLYKLRPATLAMLDRIRSPERELIWPWPYCDMYLWSRLHRIFEQAGFPRNRAYGFHIFRRSMASHAEAAGANATELLMHSARSVTERYLDRRICPRRSAVEFLFPIGSDNQS